MVSSTFLIANLAFAGLPLAAARVDAEWLKNIFGSIGTQLSQGAPFRDLAQFNFDPYEVSDMSILCERLQHENEYQCRLDFHWFDPNSVRQNLVTSGRCTTRWAWDGTTPISANEDGTGGAVGYRRCWSDKETSFDVAIPSFFHPGNFTIEMAHRYRDDENFTAPWNHPTTFAERAFCLCEEEGLRNRMYHYRSGPFKAQIIGLTA